MLFYVFRGIAENMIGISEARASAPLFILLPRHAP